MAGENNRRPAALRRPAEPNGGTEQTTTTSGTLQAARDILLAQAHAVAGLAETLSGKFVAAVELVATCSNRLIVTGVGKSGFVARLVAASFVRTGMPSSFLHPTDAIHGDLGTIRRDDLVLAISRSGRTDEVLALLPHLRDKCRSLLAIVGDCRSPLGAGADLALEVAVDEPDGAPLPTVFSLAALAVADALALAVMNRRALPRERLALDHPGGYPVNDRQSCTGSS